MTSEKKTEAKSLFDWDIPATPLAWDFNKNTMIEGRIERKGHVDLFEKPSEYLNVKTKEGVFTVWVSTVIHSRMEDETAVVGDYIGIKALGETTSRKGAKYLNFDVRVLKAPKEVVD